MEHHQEKTFVKLVVSPYYRVAEVGSLSFGKGKNGHTIFVKHVFTIFAKNATFLRVIANLEN